MEDVKRERLLSFTNSLIASTVCAGVDEIDLRELISVYCGYKNKKLHPYFKRYNILSIINT